MLLSLQKKINNYYKKKTFSLPPHHNDLVMPAINNPKCVTVFYNF